MKKAFITGATGFIGSSLIKALIKNTEIKEFKLLVRNKEKAKEGLLEIREIAESLGKKVHLIEGDITKTNLGLSLEETGKLKEIEEAYHLASNVSLSNEEKNKEEIFQSNINGTKNILEFFKGSRLQNCYFFSSAFCCGKAKSLVKEAWLEKPVKFRNFYEESKWEAENLVKNYIQSFNMPIIILRPSIVAVSSNEDFSRVKNQTFYFYSRILRKAVKINSEDNQIRLLGTQSPISNMIKLNDLIKILLEIRNLNEKKLIYNLINPSILSTKFLTKAVEEILDFKQGFIFLKKLDYSTLSEAEKFIYDKTKPYFEYNLDEILNWDCSNTKEIREKINFQEIDNNWIKEHLREFLNFLENEK